MTSYCVNCVSQAWILYECFHAQTEFISLSQLSWPIWIWGVIYSTEAVLKQLIKLKNKQRQWLYNATELCTCSHSLLRSWVTDIQTLCNSKLLLDSPIGLEEQTITNRSIKDPFRASMWIQQKTSPTALLPFLLITCPIKPLL